MRSLPESIEHFQLIFIYVQITKEGLSPVPSVQWSGLLSQSDFISIFSFTETFQRLLHRNPIILMPFNKISLDSLILLSTVFIIIGLIKMFSQSGSPSSLSELPTLIRAGAKISPSQCLGRSRRLHSQVISQPWTEGAAGPGAYIPLKISPPMSPRGSVSWWTKPGPRWRSWILSRLMLTKGKYSKRTSRGWRRKEMSVRTRTQGLGCRAQAQVITILTRLELVWQTEKSRNKIADNIVLDREIY